MIRNDKDWIECDTFQTIISSISESDCQLTNQSIKDTDPLVQYTKDQVQDWYYNRTVEIENLSGLVDVAVKFAELAISNGCRVLSETVENLRYFINFSI